MFWHISKIMQVLSATLNLQMKIEGKFLLISDFCNNSFNFAILIQMQIKHLHMLVQFEILVNCGSRKVGFILSRQWICTASQEVKSLPVWSMQFLHFLFMKTYLRATPCFSWVKRLPFTSFPKHTGNVGLKEQLLSQLWLQSFHKPRDPFVQGSCAKCGVGMPLLWPNPSWILVLMVEVMLT